MGRFTKKIVTTGFFLLVGVAFVGCGFWNGHRHRHQEPGDHMKSDTETRSMRGQRGGYGERRRRRTRRKSPADSETKKPVKQSIDVGGEETDESRSSSRSESEASSPEDRTDSPAGREELIALGRETYDKNCASCHGADREGSTFAYPALTNLSERLSREETRRVIENGPGSMPAFNQLSDQKKDALVEFLHK